MSELPFRPLDILQKKPILTERVIPKIYFKNTTITNINGNQTIETEEFETEKIENPIKKDEQKTMGITITDKRRTSNINREYILDKLRKKDELFTNVTSDVPRLTLRTLIPENIPAPNIILPIPSKTGKRLVMKEDESIKKLKPKEGELFEVPEQKEGEVLEELEDELTDLKQLLELKEPALLDEEVTAKIMEPEKEKEPEKEQEQGKEKIKRVRKLKLKAPVIAEKPVDLTTAVIRTQKVSDRLPKERERVIIKAPTYYMNNRKIFIQKLTELFRPYRQELIDAQESVSCDSRSQNIDFDLLTHQKIVRDYFNLYTPYRGVLLYHGLGSGKTCSSIALAEGMKSDKRVFVMTPASLKMNFFSEMKKCGDQLYKKNQFWEFVSIDGKPDYVGILSRALSLSVEYIRKHNGAWLLNINKGPNFTELKTEEQDMIDEQLNEMIRSKYTDLNYNGLNMKKIQLLTSDFTKNPFDNSVVIIDEAHNFVSRIVNKIKKPKSISYMLYDYLMSATNARIVLLTGTPIINYPNEIGILYNILRGYIKTWTMTANATTSNVLNTDSILKMLDDGNLKTFDYVEYSQNKLSITRNPFGFINSKKRGALKTVKEQKKETIKPPKKETEKTRKLKIKTGGKISGKNTRKNNVVERIDYEEQEIEPEASAELAYNQGYNFDNNPYSGGASDVFERYDGIRLDETGNISDSAFLDKVLSILNKNGIQVQQNTITINNYKALPDDSETFLNTFVDADSGEAKNINLFQRRILGLTSYFRSAQEQLLPRYEQTESGDNYHIIKTEMSSHQFGIYEKIRKIEADREKQTKKATRKQGPGQNAEELFTISSTYRIFSRACCNFAFPPGIDRPVPDTKAGKEVSENIFDTIKPPVIEGVVDLEEDEEDIMDSEATNYAKRIEKAMEDVNVIVEGTNESQYLSKEALPMYSPKFAKVLENLTSPENEGLHLLYSHFRTIEGIGILRLILLANGFAEFKIKNIDSNWEIVENEADVGKPTFVLYTGTESTEEKEIIRNVYNGTWDFVPASIATVLKEKAENNTYGEIIKVFMITSSGAEGINLRNTRYVHIIEPYWHMVRVEQVVGRARRICSHQELPEELRTVKVFLYVSTFSEQQKTDDKNIELRIRDISRIDKKTPVTTDESLYEIASVKQRINNQILQAVKETAIDCNLFSAISAKKPSDETLVCYGFGKVESNQFASYPSFEKDREGKAGLDVRTIQWEARSITIGGIEYALNENTMEVYDFESYQRANRSGVEPILVGKLVNERGQYKLVKT